MVKHLVYGSYPSVMDANEEVQYLIRNGISGEAITLVGDETVLSKENAPYNKVYDSTSRDEGFLSSLLGTSGKKSGDARQDNLEEMNLEGYQQALDNHEILVIVDQKYAERLNTIPPARETVRTKKEGKVKLHEEKLNPVVRENKADSGDVNIQKRVVEEPETVDVPVRREQVNITHRNVENEKAVDPNAFQEEEFTVHVSREEPEIKRETVVTDEVDIEKTVEVDHKKVTKPTRKEILDVEKEDEPGR